MKLTHTLSRWAENKFKKDVFSYYLKDGKVELNAPDELKLLEDIKLKSDSTECKIMVVESALFSPRILYRLKKYLDKLSEAHDISFVISNVMIIFASKGKAFNIKNHEDIQIKALVEIDNGILNGGTCLDCHWGHCTHDPDIAKAYTI